MKRLLGIATILLFAGVVFFWLDKPTESQSTDPVLIGAGDIADAYDYQLMNATATASLITAYPTATVFANGDLTHANGSDADFLTAYNATWGPFRARTIPVLGNHEYFSLRGLSFFNYWGNTVGDPSKGYYSLNLGTWHIIVLNANCSWVPCGNGSPQEKWLTSDLAANTSTCTLALWHQPLYTSSSSVSPTPAVQTFWTDLYNANADLIVNGHAHNYERFAPQDAKGNLDTTRGIVEIVAGTGGASHFAFNTTPAANSLVRNSTAYGVLKLTLHPTSYDWQFIPVAGQSFTDSGTQVCH